MTSPMKRPGLHDTFVLLDGAKRRPLPGVARVTVSLGASQDAQTPPASETAVTNLNEATADITVQLTMWTAEQWEAYQSLLGVFRASKTVFTSPHPELRARRVKRLYFVSEQNEAYSPSTGYRVSLRFSEKLKTPAASTTGVGNPTSLDTPLGVTSTGPNPGMATGTATTAAGQALKDAAIRIAVQTPAPKSLNGVNDVSEGGYCSAFERVVGRAAGLPDSLYGGTAKATAAKFKAAGMSVPYSSASQSGLEIGDTVFYDNDPSGAGHAGTFIGYGADGTALVMSNNIPTYRARGGELDAAGRPTGFDKFGKKVDARGVQPLTKLGTPTSIGKPYKVAQSSVRSGPAYTPPPVSQNVPLPVNRPSQSVSLPPPAALTPYQQLKVIAKP